ncbi:MAG TPA: valine--tRNA ligase [Bryobacteraceae bacterium]|jgi:valyl-tRNA synthetase|nr:valine--tRNA ligase [Bryobacteraceae bacterium]
MLLEKAYEPQKFEPHWAQWWIESGLYRPERHPGRAGVFSIVIPPPNVTGSLHIGHMLEHTVMDVAVRWHRMKGETTLWVPGTDHAGIATQMVVERELTAQGLNRRQLGREEFERRVWQWKEEYGGRINNQIRREGASVDWSRERFTMDPGLSRAVREAFVRLWDKGLIYRGEYMVNWCPSCQTAISDVETIHESEPGRLWHIRYAVKDSDESLVVATTRPETMLGDTALAVNPDDPRYQHLHGKTAVLPILDREIRIIADTMVDPEFGTGVVKITPAHDPNDFEAGRRHSLPSVKVIDEDARMTAAAGPYAGLDRFEARKRIVAALEASSELVKTEPYIVNLSKCSRSRTIIEPLVSMQWFMRMRTLADQAVEAVRSGRIRFVPDDREVVFFQWMENIRDWCISRQLWWGHRIPAWHCRHCGKTTVAREAPSTCPHCQSTEVEQETDVLDTWFSSGLWPFSTLGWPEETEDLKTYYPNTLLITGFDILFFWVSRMMMLGIEMTGDVPFREVHLHGLVRDAEKQKISKTKGNTIDPLVMMDKYGTDACRIGLLISASAGADIALKDDRLEASRAFANKLWNASRLLFLNLERSKVVSWTSAPFPHDYFEDSWIYGRLNHAATTVNAALASHRYHEAAQTLWNFVWHEFCDWYLEVKKLRFREDSGQDTHWTAALTIYESMLRLLHPFMPFITEELWQRLIHALPGDRQFPVSISLECFPAGTAEATPATLFLVFQQAVTAARELRADNKLDSKSTLPAAIYLHGSLFKEEDLGILKNLTRLDIYQHPGAISDRSGLIRSTPDFDLQIQAAAPSANGTAGVESVARVSKEIATLARNIENSKRQLADPAFLSRAPEKVVVGLRTKLAEYEVQLKKNKDLLEGLDR